MAAVSFRTTFEILEKSYKFYAASIGGQWKPYNLDDTFKAFQAHRNATKDWNCHYFRKIEAGLIRLSVPNASDSNLAEVTALFMSASQYFEDCQWSRSHFAEAGLSRLARKVYIAAVDWENGGRISLSTCIVISELFEKISKQYLGKPQLENIGKMIFLLDGMVDLIQKPAVDHSLLEQEIEKISIIAGDIIACEIRDTVQTGESKAAAAALVVYDPTKALLPALQAAYLQDNFLEIDALLAQAETLTPEVIDFLENVILELYKNNEDSAALGILAYLPDVHELLPLFPYSAVKKFIVSLITKGNHSFAFKMIFRMEETERLQFMRYLFIRKIKIFITLPPSPLLDDLLQTLIYNFIENNEIHHAVFAHKLLGIEKHVALKDDVIDGARKRGAIMGPQWMMDTIRYCFSNDVSLDICYALVIQLHPLNEFLPALFQEQFAEKDLIPSPELDPFLVLFCDYFSREKRLEVVQSLLVLMSDQSEAERLWKEKYQESTGFAEPEAKGKAAGAAPKKDNAFSLIETAFGGFLATRSQFRNLRFKCSLANQGTLVSFASNCISTGTFDSAMVAMDRIRDNRSLRMQIPPEERNKYVEENIKKAKEVSSNDIILFLGMIVSVVQDMERDGISLDCLWRLYIGRELHALIRRIERDQLFFSLFKYILKDSNPDRRAHLDIIFGSIEDVDLRARCIRESILPLLERRSDQDTQKAYYFYSQLSPKERDNLLEKNPQVFLALPEGNGRDLFLTACAEYFMRDIKRLGIAKTLDILKCMPKLYFDRAKGMQLQAKLARDFSSVAAAAAAKPEAALPSFEADLKELFESTVLPAFLQVVKGVEPQFRTPLFSRLVMVQWIWSCKANSGAIPNWIEDPKLFERIRVKLQEASRIMWEGIPLPQTSFHFLYSNTDDNSNPKLVRLNGILTELVSDVYQTRAMQALCDAFFAKNFQQ